MTVTNRGRFLPRFPSTVTPSGPITSTQAGLTLTLGADFRPLGAAGSSYDTSSLAVIQDATTGAFSKVTLANLLANNQPLDPTLTALAALNDTAGLLEQTGADAFTKRAIGTASSASVPTLGDADARYALQTTTITAGTGLSGGGDLSTNRTLTLANTAVTPGAYTIASITVDAQGRITSAANGTAGAGDVVGPASSVNNNIALFDGTTGKLLKDAAVGLVGAGRLRQIAVGTHASATTTTSTSYAATSLQVSVTPQSVSNRILLFAMVPVRVTEASTAADGRARIQRTAPSANTEAEGPWGVAIGGAASVTFDGTMMLIGSATPASTALHTYVWEHRVVVGGDSFTSFQGSFTGYLVALEVTP